MKPHSMALAALAGLFLAGCRSGGNQELLERELRHQEDQIYLLEDQLGGCECALESAQRENAALKRDQARGGGDSSSSPVIDFPGAGRNSGRGGRPEALEPPMVEPGVEIDPGQEFDPSKPAEGASSSGRVTDQSIQRIVLNKQLTGGVNHEGRGGDGGVLVVFEPRNKAGQLLATPGEVSIAVLDPQQPGPQARIARWDFTAAEAAENFRKTALGRGYHFELPWPGEPPVNRRLELYVRYVTPDGRKLLANMPLDIAPPAAGDARRWRGVPAGSRRSQVAAMRAARVADAAAAYAGADARSRARYSDDVRSDDAAQMPVARLLDPPQIIPEQESSDDDDADRLADERDAAQKKAQQSRTARPTWSPFR